MTLGLGKDVLDRATKRLIIKENTIKAFTQLNQSFCTNLNGSQSLLFHFCVVDFSNSVEDFLFVCIKYLAKYFGHEYSYLFKLQFSWDPFQLYLDF